MNDVAVQRHASRSRQLLWAALGLGLLLGLMAAAFIAYEVVELRQAELERVEMQARALEDKVDGDLSAAESILRSVAVALRQGQGAEPTRLTGLFEDMVSGRPYLRSLSLLDAEGLVLFSSQELNRGARIPPNLFEGPSHAGGARLGRMMVGRDLHEFAPGALDQARARAMPLSLELELRGRPLRLVALLNPEHFATQFERVLGGEGMRALLLELDGRVLENSDLTGAVPGRRLDSLPIFTRYLPRQEQGSLIGVGSMGEEVFGAFRLTRHWPLVLLVEHGFDRYWHELQRLSLIALGLVLLCWSLVASAARIGWRALRRDEELSHELRETHEASVASELRKQAMLQSSLDAIVTINGEGRVLEFNAAAESMFGRSSAEALGQPMHELIVPPKLRQAHVDGMARYHASGVGPVLGRRIEIEAMRADGSLFPVELTIAPVQAGGETLFTATLRDITERQRAETALRASQAVLDRTGRIAGVGGWTVNLESRQVEWTDQSFRIHDLEPGAQPSFEQAKSYFPPNARAASEAAVQRLIETGEPIDAELPLITAKGRKIWVRVVAELEYAEGKPSRLVGAFQDITAMRVARRELDAARQRELEIGARIQRSLLVTPPPTEMEQLQISSFSQASQGIDGDFVEVIRVGPDCVDIIAGDVMGKGMGAAMMGAATKLQFSRSITELLSQHQGTGILPRPAEVVAAVHRAMTPTLQSLDAFVTLCYMRVDASEGSLVWVGCGHEETLWVGVGGTARQLHNQHPPLGVLDELSYQESAHPWWPGDALFMCSDGVTDALREDGERVGRERVNRVVQRRLALHATPGAALHGARRELLEHGVRLVDDVTMVMVRRPQLGERQHLVRIELEPELPALRRAQAFSLEQGKAAGLDEAGTGLLAVAVVEAFTNIVRHGRGLMADAPVELLARRDDAELVFELVYPGEAFEPPEQTIPSRFDGYPEGGFGLHIIEGAFDAVSYGHQDGVNSLRMSRRLGPRGD